MLLDCLMPYPLQACKQLKCINILHLANVDSLECHALHLPLKPILYHVSTDWLRSQTASISVKELANSACDGLAGNGRWIIWSLLLPIYGITTEATLFILFFKVLAKMTWLTWMLHNQVQSNWINGRTLRSAWETNLLLWIQLMEPVVVLSVMIRVIKARSSRSSKQNS
jgi:hypothetical protein